MIVCGNQIDTQTHNKVANIFSLLLNKPIQGVINIHPAYNSLMLSLDYDVDILDVVKKIKILISDNAFIEKELKRNIVNIPVCYDPSIGPDLMRVCELNNLTIEDVIRLHTSKKYLVYFIGFTLGFPYLGHLDEKLHTPRLDSPRIQVPAGSIAIGGNQTGIYPFQSAGGWNLIGKTPITVYNKHKPSKSLFQMGDEIRFVPINIDEFNKLNEI